MKRNISDVDGQERRKKLKSEQVISLAAVNMEKRQHESLVTRDIPDALIECMKDDVWEGDGFPDDIERQRDDIPVNKNVMPQETVVEQKLDYEDGSYTKEKGHWKGWGTNPILYHSQTFQRFMGRTSAHSTLVNDGLGTFMYFITNAEHGVLEIIGREASSHASNKKKMNRVTSTTLMKLITTWAEHHGYEGFRRGIDISVTPAIRARQGVVNKSLADTLQETWLQRTTFQNPMKLIELLLTHDPDYNYKLGSFPTATKGSQNYINRWFLLLQRFAMLIRHMTNIPNTMSSWMTGYKRRFQAISGLSMKPGVVWSTEQIQSINFDIPTHMRRFFNISISQNIAAANKNPHNFTAADIIRIRETLLGYDFQALRGLQRIPDGEERELDEICCAAVLLVQLLIGSRFIEVLRISDYFSKYDLLDHATKMSDTDVVVYKIAKDSRNKIPLDVDVQSDSLADVATVSNTVLPYKPVLFSYPPQMIRCLVYKYIRPYIALRCGSENLDNQRLTSKFQRTAIKVLKKALGNGYVHEVEAYNHSLSTKKTASKAPTMKIGTHLLRKLYANYSYDTLAEKTISRNAWIQSVLGHSPKSISTSISYTNVVINTAAPQLSGSEQQAERIWAELVYLKDEVSRLRSKLGELDSGFVPESRVAVRDRDHKIHYIERLPKIRGQQLIQAKRIANILRSKNVKVTVALLRQFGYGTQHATLAARSSE